LLQYFASKHYAHRKRALTLKAFGDNANAVLGKLTNGADLELCGK